LCWFRAEEIRQSGFLDGFSRTARFLPSASRRISEAQGLQQAPAIRSSGYSAGTCRGTTAQSQAGGLRARPTGQDAAAEARRHAAELEGGECETWPRNEAHTVFFRAAEISGRKFEALSEGGPRPKANFPHRVSFDSATGRFETVAEEGGVQAG